LSCEFKVLPGEKYSFWVKAENINQRMGKVSKAAKTIVVPMTPLMKEERQWPSEAKTDDGRRCTRAIVGKYRSWPVKNIPGFKRVQSTCDGKLLFISKTRVQITPVQLFYREVPGEFQPVPMVSEKTLLSALDLTNSDERAINRAVASIEKSLIRMGYNFDSDDVYPVNEYCVARRNDRLSGKTAYWDWMQDQRNWRYNCGISGEKLKLMMRKTMFDMSWGVQKFHADFKWTYDSSSCVRRPCDTTLNHLGQPELRYLTLVIRIS
jgi:hypothetical protein